MVGFEKGELSNKVISRRGLVVAGVCRSARVFASQEDFATRACNDLLEYFQRHY